MNSYQLTIDNEQLPKGYKQTEVGVIPEDWEVKDFSDFCLLQRGFDITESTRISGNVPVYSSSGLAYFHKESKVSPPGVVTGRKGILGKVFYIKEPFWPHDTTLWVKDFKGNDAKYVSFYLTYFDLERFDAATSVPTLNRNNLVGIPIPVPPVEEQRSIAQALSDVDALIAALERAIAKKRAIKTATMQQLLTGKKRLPGFGEGKGYKETEIGAIPEDWIACTIQDLVEEGILEKPLDGNHGNIHPKSSDYVYFGIPFIMSNDIYHGRIDIQNCHFIKKEQADKLRKGFSVEGDVLLTHKGTVGNVAIVPKIPVEYLMLTPQVTYYRVKDASRLNNTFIKFYFECSNFQLRLEQLSGGGTRAYIGIVNQRQLPFILPSVEEQREIATVLSDMDAEIAALESRLAKTQSIKQGMMQELLTGRTRLV